jgi:steroid 5-alpha reductase family enzyme
MSPNETTVLVVFAYVTIAWLKTVSSGNVTVMDVLWGMGFVLIAWTRFLLYDSFNIAALACLVCVNLWGLRLGYVLHQRTKNRGEDPRYVRMRDTAGRHWWWVSFLQVFLLQGVLLLLIALPIFLLIPGPSKDVEWTVGKIVLSTVCLIGFIIGLLLEHIADMELKRFREINGPGHLKTDGMFSITRHPNHLGEATLWWSIGGFAVVVGGSNALPALLGPIILTLLLRFVSGVKMSEVDLQDREGYQSWVSTTPAMFANPISALLKKNAD